MSDTQIADRYRRATTLFQSGKLAEALDAFRDLIAITEPIEETETDTEVILPFQAEAGQLGA